ncbi:MULTISPECIES: calcium/sodium antiporter [Pseudovibrio]|uniref:calcium/sodium antiporter n=1 Tax=Stappiaceae TaxID=2821832 RepID=UPI002366AC59|nr:MULTISPECIES: calcium/sodium antiporter [Pseudovibrio]MDD7910218.1 calcium/sodium antiporter [Pseudovibrio exalbescens]MDX5593931.1 calcium/sodium antiporter [Pseudovibrio sp. SPO723]
MFIAYLSLIGGLTALIFAGDFLVRGSVGIAKMLGIPSLVIGLTIVAFGTSAPELVISLDAALQGNGGISIGNVVGSNIANVLLVMGLPALLAPTPCDERGATRSAVFMVAVSLVFIAMCFYGPLHHVSGVILLGLLVVFLSWSAYTAHQHRKALKAATSSAVGNNDLDELDVEAVPENSVISFAFVCIGLVGLPIGAHYTIEGAVVLASAWGVSDAVIGLTVVALGTSLPELATTLMAAVRQHAAVALGNVIGSNVFNILAILGITSVIAPIPVPEQILQMDVWVMLGCALLLLYFAGRRVCLSRGWGALLTIGYISYIYGVFALGKV